MDSDVKCWERMFVCWRLVCGRVVRGHWGQNNFGRSGVDSRRGKGRQVDTPTWILESILYTVPD
jgi:hypothetical protein